MCAACRRTCAHLVEMSWRSIEAVSGRCDYLDNILGHAMPRLPLPPMQHSCTAWTGIAVCCRCPGTSLSLSLSLSPPRNVVVSMELSCASEPRDCAAVFHGAHAAGREDPRKRQAGAARQPDAGRHPGAFHLHLSLLAPSRPTVRGISTSLAQHAHAFEVRSVVQLQQAHSRAASLHSNNPGRVIGKEPSP